MKHSSDAAASRRNKPAYGLAAAASGAPSASATQRSTLPLPYEVMHRIYDALDDRDVLAWRGVNKHCQAQAEDPHLWYGRSVQRGYLRPAPDAQWLKSNMLLHYRAQANFVDTPLLTFAGREVVHTRDPVSMRHAETMYPRTLPELRITGDHGGNMSWVAATYPHLRHLEITQMTSLFSSANMDELAKLAALESLSVTGFGLWSLSGRVIQDVARALPNLSRLCIEGGTTRDEHLLPLASMQRLQALALRDMPNLVGFSPAMQPMPSVTNLDLRCAEATPAISRKMLQDIVRVFPNLTALTLDHRPIEDEADLHILSHLKLTSLSLVATDIQTIPDALCLPTLRALDVSGNDRFVLPNAAKNMQALVDLDMCSTAIVAIPPAIAELTSLRKLDVSSNTELRLFEPLQALTWLKSLNLAFCGLPKVPAPVLQLTSLQSLRLNGNALKGLPLRFERLTRLTHLDLRDNEHTWSAWPRALRHMRALRCLGTPSMTRRATPRFADFHPNLRALALDDETVRYDRYDNAYSRKTWTRRDVLRLLGGSTNLRFVATDSLWLNAHANALHERGVRPRIMFNNHFRNCWDRA